MIKFENTDVYGFEAALRGMRNPLNSWEKGDSAYGCHAVGDRKDVICGAETCELYAMCNKAFPHKAYIIGPNDLNLAQRLIKAGSDHRKFMRQIFVSVDITAPLYWWKEFDTYKVATVSNSCSTMHKIHAKEFTLEDFSCEHLDDGSYNALRDVIVALNDARVNYINLKNKHYWWNMIQLLPSSYNQRRTITLNYETLRNIYGSRRGHKLDEWSVGFMSWIDSLPYAEELIKFNKG